MLGLRQGNGQAGKKILERKFYLIKTQQEDTWEPGSSCHKTPNLLAPWSWTASEHPRSAFGLLFETHFHTFTHTHSTEHWGSNPAHWALGWGRGHKTKQDTDSPSKNSQPSMVFPPGWYLSSQKALLECSSRLSPPCNSSQNGLKHGLL